MSHSSRASFYIGWDVGGWTCDKNQKSRDAIVILDSALTIIGQPWRGNLRTVINDASCTDDWIRALFALCAAPRIDTVQVTLAIDTPLSFSEAFAQLLTGLKCVDVVDDSATNPYLFRRTERYLFECGLSPLSAIKDMIGSQATKGRHVFAKFAPTLVSCGVWTDGVSLIAIEAYPSPCKKSETVRTLLRQYPALDHADKQEALTCAMIAYMFASNPHALASPDDSVPINEGWIWVPKDVLVRRRYQVAGGRP